MKKSIAYLAILAMIMTLFAVPSFAEDPVNLITNGGFEAGNTGFTSDYAYVSNPSTSGGLYGLGSLDPEQHYAIGTNPSLYHQFWADYCAHNDSNMMIVNATPSIPEKTVWTETLDLPATVASHILYAGQNKEVGEVLVKNDSDYVWVKFVLNADAIEDGWLITETHVAVAGEAAGIPQTKKGNPIPGQFPMSEILDPGMTETEWYRIDGNSEWSDSLFIAAHAVVERISTLESETAWGGESDFSGKNWAKYITYTTLGNDYRFSFWAANSHADNPSVLDVSVNGDIIGTAYLNQIASLGTWNQYIFDFDWNASVETEAVISIVDAFTIAQGDDFALDDISLVKLP